jgi:hypothetical protein
MKSIKPLTAPAEARRASGDDHRLLEASQGILVDVSFYLPNCKSVANNDFLHLQFLVQGIYFM